MTDWLQIFVLAIIQGLTEFLPISSSAHLILLPTLTGWTDQGISFDIAVHFGTLIAVVIYFQHDLKTMMCDTLLTLKGHKPTLASRQALWLMLATIPVCVFGYLFHDFIAESLRSPTVIAWSTILFGLLLFASDQFAKTQTLNEVGFRKALFIGFAQALALIPGTSRSGITITAGLTLGLSRQAAARFSFLLAMPVIFIAMSYEMLKLIKAGNPVHWSGLATSTVLSCLFALICIHFFLKLIDRLGMTPFVIYRLLLGCLLLYVF